MTPEHVLVNGAEVSTGMALAQRLGVAETEFSRSLTLQENSIGFPGEAATSFDSAIGTPLSASRLSVALGRFW